jgi:shikimate dehydrogenase
MRAFGLIGKSLSHSFSKNYFDNKFTLLHLNDCSYSNFELEKIEDIISLLQTHPNLQGLNVTIPYKETVIPFLNELSEEAKQVGAVNCIQIKNKKLIGHNTDVYGFSQSLKPFLDVNHERALILGTGGVSKAVAHVLQKIGLPVFFVTSAKTKKTDNTFFYHEINERVMDAFKLIVNTTPIGTFPNINECPPLPYEFFTPQHLAYDLIYNPGETKFLRQASDKGSIVVNGLSMLQLQAEKSWEIWNQD